MNLLKYGVLLTLILLPTLASSSIIKCPQFLEAIDGASRSERVAMERFFVPIEHIRSMLTRTDLVTSQTDFLREQDARKFAFQIEGLFRLYEMGPWRLLMKQFEDNLGDFVDYTTYSKLALELQAPDPVVHYLRGHAQGSRAALIRILRNQGWLLPEGKKSFFTAVAQDLTTKNWEKQKDDRKFVIDQLIANIEEIKSTKYDMHELETGLHKFRRDLRWILIYIHMLRGKIEIDDDAPISPGSKKILVGFQPNDKYLKFDRSEEVKKRIWFRESHYHALSHAVQVLGDIKDRGVAYEVLAEAFQGSGLSFSLSTAREQSRRLLEANDRSTTYLRDALAFYKLLKQSKIFDEMIEDLKAQR